MLTKKDLRELINLLNSRITNVTKRHKIHSTVTATSLLLELLPEAPTSHWKSYPENNPVEAGLYLTKIEYGVLFKFKLVGFAKGNFTTKDNVIAFCEIPE